MSKMVSMIVDGATVRAPGGSSLLDAALEAGICIPNLCHLPGVHALGGCRVCIVEVVAVPGSGRTRLTASCTLEAREGLVVNAHSPDAIRARRNIVEMLLAEAPNSRAIQDLAVRVGVRTVHYPMRNKNCILCGRCVRICDEVWQSKSLGFVGRGHDRHVALPFNTRPSTSAPTGTLIGAPVSITASPTFMPVFISGTINNASARAIDNNTPLL